MSIISLPISKYSWGNIWWESSGLRHHAVSEIVTTTLEKSTAYILHHANVYSSFPSDAGNISHIHKPSPPDLLAHHQALVCTSINIQLIKSIKNNSLALSQVTGNHCSQFLSTSVTITWVAGSRISPCNLTCPCLLQFIHPVFSTG